MQPVICQWQLGTATSIVGATTPVAGQRALPLNGTLAIIPNASLSGISFSKVSRVISITSQSSTSLSGVNFTITGIYNNSVVSQTISGPGSNATVYTSQMFSTVASVTYSADVTTMVSVGTGAPGLAPVGSWGVTDWFRYDFFTPFSMLTTQAKVNAATVNYSLEVTLDDIVTTPEASLTLFNPIAGMTNATTNQIGNISFPIRYARLKFNNATNSAGSLTATFLQQGLR